MALLMGVPPAMGQPAPMAAPLPAAPLQQAGALPVLPGAPAGLVAPSPAPAVNLPTVANTSANNTSSNNSAATGSSAGSSTTTSTNTPATGTTNTSNATTLGNVTKNINSLLTDAPAGNASASTDGSVAVEATTVENKTFSYGRFPVSVMFTPAQVNDMKQALQLGETKAVATPEAPKAANAAVAAAPAEPAKYPVFYLSSIVYRAPGDWAIWVSGHKITPLKNDTEVKVLAVSAAQATLSWTPSFQAAIASRRAQKSFADPAPLKNRLVSPNPVQFNDSTGTASVTLRPNQTFVAGYMAAFEGYVDSPAMPVSAGAKAAATAAAAAAPAAKEASGGLAQDAINRMAAKVEAEQQGHQYIPPAGTDGLKTLQERYSTP